MFWELKPKTVTGDIHSDLEILRDLPPFEGALLAFWPKGMPPEESLPSLVWHKLSGRSMAHLIFRLFLQQLATDRSWESVIKRILAEAVSQNEELLRIRELALAQQKALSEKPFTDF